MKTRILSEKIQRISSLSFSLCLLIFFLLIGGQIIMTLKFDHQAVSLDKAPSYPPRALLNDLSHHFAEEAPLVDHSDNNAMYKIHQGNLSLTITDAPPIKSGEKLVGIIWSGRQDKNIAIVEGKGEQISYGQGDKISGNLVIIRILRDRLIVDEDGYYASLHLRPLVR